ncbi:MAG: L-malate glycosyltransferase [Actinomycetota bacterium]|nr:L-malate glycosyltransferase [Actinomycetota bacterium]
MTSAPAPAGNVLALPSVRVVIVSGIFPPDIGGPATHAADLARALRGRDHDVVVLSLTDGPATDRGSDLVLLPRRWPWPVRLTAATWWLLRHRRAYDVVYATGLELPAVAGSRLARRPVVLKVPGDSAWERGRRHGLTTLDFDEFQEASGGPFRLRAMRRVRNWAARNASALVVPSRYLGAMAGRWADGRTPVTVVLNGVQAPAAGPGRVGPTPVPDSAGGLRLVFVGRLVAHKRVEILLDAVAASHPSVTLDIVGTGPEEAALGARAEALGVADRVRFVGSLPHDDVMRRLAAADALVSATSYEGLPHVVIEALVCGTPVITTPAGGVVEVISDGDNGRLVDPADAGAFAAVFEELRADAGLRARMSARAALAGREWGFDRCADEIEGLLAAVCGADQRVPAEGPTAAPRPRPRAVYFGRASVTWPPGDDQRRKLAIHARQFRQLSISTGPVGRRDVAGVKVILLPRLRPRVVGAALFYGVGPVLAVAAAARPGESVVVCQSPFEAVGVVVARALVPRRLRPRLQVELHGDWRTASRMYGSRWRGVIARPADAAATWALRRAERVRAVSVALEELARDAGYTGPIDRHVTYSEFDVFLDTPPVDPPDRPVVAFVGVLERYKAVDVLLDAWPAVAARVPDAQLVLVGAGSRQDEVEHRLAADGMASARRVDPMPQAELSAVLDHASCLVLPSRSEGLPRIVLEAMARGRPVVASDVGGMRELVDSSTGRLVPAEDVLGLVEALVEVLADPGLARAMGSTARARAERRRPAAEYEAGIGRLADWVRAGAKTETGR